MTFKTSALHVLAVAAITGTLVTAGPCDIYASGNTPCVAAHSTTRALYNAYTGNLYQVIRGSDNATTNITPLKAGGVANAAAQDSFCSGTTCLIKIIYDQSGNGNHLTQAPPGGEASGPDPGGYDFLASATGAAVTLGGQKAYGVFTTLATGYRVDVTKGVATGNDPEGIYAVVDGTHYNDMCCFDYGNAETNNKDDRATTMESLYFGAARGNASGTGNGPWVQADLEDSLFAGNQAGGTNPSNPSLNYRFVTGILKGNSSNLWSLRGGNAASGGLTTFYAGPRPSGYYPMHKQGAIILGIGGDNSQTAQGTFYEGCMTQGFPTDAIENSVQQNIVAAGYATTTQSSGPAVAIGSNVAFQSASNTGMYLGHSGTNVALMAYGANTNFTTTAPNDGTSGCVSFEAVNAPGSFLRHYAYQLFLDPPSGARYNAEDYPSDSTFCPEVGFTGSSSSSFRSWSYPTRYWRVVNGGSSIFIGQNGGPFAEDSASGFNTQASWTVSTT